MALKRALLAGVRRAQDGQLEADRGRALRLGIVSDTLPKEASVGISRALQGRRTTISISTLISGL